MVEGIASDKVSPAELLKQAAQAQNQKAASAAIESKSESSQVQSEQAAPTQSGVGENLDVYA